eukprot:scaffold1.g5333.t1
MPSLKRAAEGAPEGGGGGPSKKRVAGERGVAAPVSPMGGSPAASLPAYPELVRSHPELVRSHPELVGASRTGRGEKSWQSQKGVKGKIISLGSYPTREEAAAAHDVGSIWAKLRDREPLHGARYNYAALLQERSLLADLQHCKRAQAMSDVAQAWLKAHWATKRQALEVARRAALDRDEGLQADALEFSGAGAYLGMFRSCIWFTPVRGASQGAFLGTFDTAEEAALAWDAANVWRRLRFPGARKSPFNFPRLHLEEDQQLLAAVQRTPATKEGQSIREPPCLRPQRCAWPHRQRPGVLPPAPAPAGNAPPQPLPALAPAPAGSSPPPAPLALEAFQRADGSLGFGNMLAALQPVLAAAGVGEAACSDFELAFLCHMDDGARRAFYTSVQRAWSLGRADSVARMVAAALPAAGA